MTDSNTTPQETQQRVVSARVERKGRKAVEKQAQQLTTLTVEYVPVSALVPNDWNPNRQDDHTFELLLRSMEEDGFTQPIVAVDLPDGRKMIVDGEHRWRAAEALGFEQVPVVCAPMTPEQARIATIRHNRARGTHDIELEAQLLRDLESLGALDWAQDSLMISDVEIQKLLEDVPAPEAFADEDFATAWVPSEFSQEEADLIRNGTGTPRAQITESNGELGVSSMTPEAADAFRRRQALIDAAKTHQDRIRAREETAVYKLHLTFAGDDAQLVKDVLGQDPASALVALCRAHAGVGAAQD